LPAAEGPATSKPEPVTEAPSQARNRRPQSRSGRPGRPCCSSSGCPSGAS
jgi:hypothetical protein